MQENPGEKSFRRSNSKSCRHVILPFRNMRWVRPIYQSIVGEDKHNYLVEPNTIIRFDHGEYSESIASISAYLENEDEMIVVVADDPQKPKRFSILHLHPSVEPTQVMDVINMELNWVRVKTSHQNEEQKVVCHKPCITLYLRGRNQFYFGLHSSLSAPQNADSIDYQTPVQLTNGWLFYHAKSVMMTPNIERLLTEHLPYNYSIDQMRRMLRSHKDFFTEFVNEVNEQGCTTDRDFALKVNHYVTMQRNAPITVLMDPDQGICRSLNGFKKMMAGILEFTFAFMLQVTPDHRDIEDLTLFVFMIQKAYGHAMSKQFVQAGKEEQALKQEMQECYQEAISSGKDDDIAIKTVRAHFYQRLQQEQKTDSVFFNMQQHARAYGEIIKESQDKFFEHMLLALRYIDKCPEYVAAQKLEQNKQIVGENNIEMFQADWPLFRAQHDGGERDIDTILAQGARTKTSVIQRALADREAQWLQNKKLKKAAKELVEYKKTCRGGCSTKVKTCGTKTYQTLAYYGQKVAPAGTLAQYGIGAVGMIYMLYSSTNAAYDFGAMVYDSGKSVLGFK